MVVGCGSRGLWVEGAMILTIFYKHYFLFIEKFH